MTRYPCPVNISLSQREGSLTLKPQSDGVWFYRSIALLGSEQSKHADRSVSNTYDFTFARDINDS